MPNFWSSTAQRVNEIFSGPRTSDKEWNLQREKFKVSNMKIDSIRNIYDNFEEYTKGIIKLTKAPNNSARICIPVFLQITMKLVPIGQPF